MPAESWLDRYTNKIVPFSFRGERLAFRLSHGLFSSFDVDDGTRLLLKTIGQRIDLASAHSVLDVGCGVGVLGASVGRAAGRASVELQDRDALAAAFAEANCRENGLEDASVRCCLAFQDLEGRRFDLVVSNLPAKAGPPVLEHFCRRLPEALADHGTAAVVVVAPIAGLVEQALRSAGCEITYSERTREYAVFHAGSPGPRPQAGPVDELAPYIRGHRSFQWRDQGWELDTAYNLPDFDTLGHALELALGMLPEEAGDAVFWNPGQGHLPLLAALRRSGKLHGITLAGRDFLELAIAGRNLRRAGFEASRIAPIPAEWCLPEVLGAGSADLLCAMPHPVPRVRWHDDLARAASVMIRPGRRLLAAGSSTEMQRLLEAARGMRVLQSRRHRGFRAVLLER